MRSSIFPSATGSSTWAWKRSTSARARRWSFFKIVRRTASVGCAVKTGSTTTSDSAARTSCAEVPRRASSSADARRLPGLRLVARAVVDRAPDAVHLLGHVDRAEVGAEGAHDVERAGRRQTRQQRFELFGRTGHSAPATPGRQARGFDGLVHTRRRELSQELAEQSTEPPDIASQRPVFRIETHVTGGAHAHLAAAFTVVMTAG